MFNMLPKFYALQQENNNLKKEIEQREATNTTLVKDLKKLQSNVLKNQDDIKRLEKSIKYIHDQWVKETSINKSLCVANDSLEIKLKQ